MVNVLLFAGQTCCARQRRIRLGTSQEMGHAQGDVLADLQLYARLSKMSHLEMSGRAAGPGLAERR